MGALSSEQTPFILLAAQLCRDVALHAGLGANLLIQPIKNTLSSLDGKAGHTGGVRYPCSDSDVRPCSHNYTHNGPFYRSVLTLRIIKNKKINPPHLIHSESPACYTTTNRGWVVSSTVLSCWEVRCRGWFGKACCWGVCVFVCRVQGADVVWWQGKVEVEEECVCFFCFLFFEIWIFSPRPIPAHSTVLTAN